MREGEELYLPFLRNFKNYYELIIKKNSQFELSVRYFASR